MNCFIIALASPTVILPKQYYAVTLDSSEAILPQCSIVALASCKFIYPEQCHTAA
jgi:hypothetical protein